MSTIKKYCPACGSLLDNEGICSNVKCKRRALQIEALEKKEEALSTVQQNRETAQSQNVELMNAFFKADVDKIERLLG